MYYKKQLRSATRLHRRKITLWLIYVMVFGFSCFVLFFIVTSAIIGKSVKDKCSVAKDRYGGDCVESLITTLKDEDNSIRERNDAIWALGQIGNERAKMTIETYYTGIIPDHEPYDEVLSQYEMKKALKLIDGGVNITHMVWNTKSLE